MNKIASVSSRQVALLLASLVFSLILKESPSYSATFNFQSNQYLLDDFQLINEAFLVSNVLSTDKISLKETITLTNLPNSSQNTLSIISLSELTANINNSPSLFTSIFNDLKQLRFSEEIGPAKIRTLPQTSAANIHKGIYDFSPSTRPKPLEQLVGNYITFNNAPASIPSLPSGYSYNNNSTSLGLFGSQALGGPKNNLAGGAINGIGNISSGGQIGISLNRVTVESTGEYDSALQLWPRTPFQLEPTGYAYNAATALEQTNDFGRLSISVNFPLIPREVFLTPLDLKVDWINRGEYSQNLRDTIQQTITIHQQSQAEFQARVEDRQQALLQQQQQYQSQVQQSISKNSLQFKQQRQKTRNSTNYRR